MTTIAYKNGVLAADRLTTHAGASHVLVRKVFEVRGKSGGTIAWAYTGNDGFDSQIKQAIEVALNQKQGDAAAAYEKLIGKRPFEPHGSDSNEYGFDLIVVSTCWPTPLMACEGSPLHPWPLMDGTEHGHALGSGAKFALGAMACGASAATAIEIAAQFDAYTGGGVDVIEVALAEASKAA